MILSTAGFPVDVNVAHHFYIRIHTLSRHYPLAFICGINFDTCLFNVHLAVAGPSQLQAGRVQISDALRSGLSEC